MRLTSGEMRGTFFDERALRFARIFSSAQRSTEFLLAKIGRFEVHSLEFAYSTQGGLDRQGRVGRDSVGRLEGPVEKFLGRHELVQEPHGKRSLRADRFRRVEEFGGMNRCYLPRQRDGGLSRWIEAEGDFFEGESGLGDGVTDLAGQHQIEAAGSCMSVDGGDQRNAKRLFDEDGVSDGPQSFEICGIDSFSPGEGLGHGNRASHVHARTEYSIAGAGEDCDPNRFILIDVFPMGGHVSKCFGIERVGLVGAIDGDESDVGVCFGSLESSGHGNCLG